MPVPDGDIAAALTTSPSADEARAFDPASLKGKPTLLVFASPTCPYCAEELPIAQRAATAESANIVAVYIAGQKKHAASVTKSLGYTGTVLVDEDGSLRKKYDIKGVPFTMVLGADGHATTAFRGLQDESTLRGALADAK
ncbi:MAG: TlpA disulfide reductase family protein [Kofleriaceae bacterium]